MKKKVKTILTQQLSEIGFSNLEKTSINGRNVFYKELTDGTILTFGIINSNLYNNCATGAFYRAISYTWAFYNPCFLPSENYQRIEKLINSKLIPKKNWWDISTIEVIYELINAIKFSEIKFIRETERTISKISENYLDYRIYIQVLRDILNQIKEQDEKKFNLKDDIDFIIKIVSNIVKEKKDIRNNKHGIKLLSFDAYNCCHFSSINNFKLIDKIGNIDNG